jgi:chromosome segregation ATPase
MALLGPDDIAKINDDIKTKETELDSKKKKEDSILVAQQEKKEFIERVSLDIKDNNEQKSKILADKAAVEKDIATFTAEVVTLEDEIKALDQAIDGIETNRAKNEVDRKEKESDIKAKQDEIAKLDTEVTDLTDSIAELDQDIAKDTKRISDLETEKAGAPNQETKDKIQAEIDDTKKSKQASEDKKAAETANKTTKANELAYCQTELATFESEMDALTVAYKSLTQSLDSNEQQKDAKITNKDEKLSDIDGAKDEKVALTDRLADVQEDIDRKTADRAKETKQLEELDLNLIEERAKIKSIEGELESLRSGALIRRHDIEKANRIEHVNITLKNKERSKALMKDEDDPEVAEEFHKDRNIFMKDIREALDIENDDIIRDAINEVRDRYENDKEGKRIYRADEAFRKSREALVDINLSGINKKIHAAIAEGLTSITVEESEISGVEILALSNLGYMVTHRPVQDPPKRLPIELTIIIDWGFAGSQH